MPNGTNANISRTIDGRDQETGRFVAGNSGNGGRKPGSRNKLAGALVDALHDDFARHGVAAIERVRVEDPAAYLRVVVAVLPKELDVALSVQHSNLFANASDFASAYRLARQVIAEPALIEADDADQAD